MLLPSGNAFTPYGTWEGLTGDRPPVKLPALIGQRDQEPEYSTVPNWKQSQETAQQRSNINQPRTPPVHVTLLQWKPQTNFILHLTLL